MDPETQAEQIVGLEDARHCGELWSTLVGSAYQGLLAAGMTKAAAVDLCRLKFATSWTTIYDDDDE
jgi:hypothetical protein